MGTYPLHTHKKLVHNCVTHSQVGVATAFNAPIGGLLFAFEEVASFFGISLGWQVSVSVCHACACVVRACTVHMCVCVQARYVFAKQAMSMAQLS